MLAESKRKVFYTLNGNFLGFAFDLEAIPWDVPLWPCVGLDTKHTLSFNFGAKPFEFDLNKMPLLEVMLKTNFDTVSVWPVSFSATVTPNPTPATPGTPNTAEAGGYRYADTPEAPLIEATEAQGGDSCGQWSGGDEEPVRTGLVPRMWPLVSKFASRALLGAFATLPARSAVRRYQTAPRWLDAVDRLVNATLIDTWLESQEGIQGPMQWRQPSLQEEAPWLSPTPVGQPTIDEVPGRE